MSFSSGSLFTNIFLYYLFSKVEALWCNQVSENIDHIFCTCTLAKQAWFILFKWLEIKPISFSTPSIEDCLKHFFADTPKSIRRIYVATLLRTIWLSSNENVFNSKKIPAQSMDVLLKQRAYAWCRDAKLVPSNQEGIWNLNPNQAFKMQQRWSKDQLFKFCFASSDLVGYPDATWK